MAPFQSQMELHRVWTCYLMQDTCRLFFLDTVVSFFNGVFGTSYLSNSLVHSLQSFGKKSIVWHNTTRVVQLKHETAARVSIYNG